MKIILASHGELALGMKQTLEMIVGEQTQIVAIDAYGDENSDFMATIEEQLVDQKSAVLVTDIWGGSVNNSLMELVLQQPQLLLITGMNLPLVLAIATAADQLTLDNLRTIVCDSQKNIILVNDKLQQLKGGENND
ncbi:PTS sugar transporter subunit IIA [Bombilactobacillus thymidiniphilus]|uniref:PTS fructose transporter subunit IIA n=1 Tax=Bombilactobacillus thymidiniphilus TaxID=2923363 RepID=A0ABY4PES1_9LACO|nr:PTS fructose transporter subunit IIA [Bombilactobacillus thymidiniphilus]UQS84194.1 PTS fructose transporter subunit IIA [Bombilactobacillus thymidiniphilus]